MTHEDDRQKIKTDFFAHQASDMSASVTSSIPLMIVFGVVAVGVLYGLFQGVMYLINFDKTNALKYVEVHLQRPVMKDNIAYVAVEVDNYNPAPVKNLAFQYTISDATGNKLAEGTATIPSMVPAGDSRTFPSVQLGEVKGVPSRIHAEPTDLKYGPKPSLPAEVSMKFTQAAADKPADAVNEYMDVVKAAPEFGPGYTGLGKALAANNDMEQARKAFEKAVKLDPDDENAHYNMGVILFYKKDRDGAKKEFEAASNLEPDDPAVADSLRLLNGGAPAKPAVESAADTSTEK